MKVDIQETSSTQRVLKIEVPAEEIAKEYQRAASDINKRVRIPGFRPGKAPLGVIEKQYKENIEEDILQKLIPAYYTRAIKDANITPLQMPFIQDVNLSTGAPLIFTVEVEIRPQFELIPYEEIELAKKDSDITEEDINAVIERLRDRLSILENHEDEHSIVNGDYVVIDSDVFIDGAPFEKGRIDKHLLEVGSKTFLEGFEDKLIGHKKGDTVEISIRYADTDQRKEFAGKEVLFRTNIKEVKKKILPDPDDEFAKDVGGFANLEELKKRVAEDLKLQKEALNREYYRNEVLKKLLAGTTLDIPPSLVEREIHHMIHNAKQGGMIQSPGKEMTKEEEEGLKKECGPIAKDRVNGFLILDTIAEKENIEVTSEEVDTEIKKLAISINKNPEELRMHIMSNKEAMAGLRSRLREDKTLDLIISKAKFQAAA